MRGVVDGAPAFFIGAAPQRRVRVEALQIEHGKADLAHGAVRVGHQITEHLLQDRIDDGVEKLRVIEPVADADLGKIIKPNCQAEFPRLHQFPAQLAGEARGFAEHEGQRGFVIMFVLRQGGATGNGGAVFDLQHERFVPLAVREQPQLLAPDAEFLFQQHRRQSGDVAEGEGHKGGERALPVFADAGHFRHGSVFQKFFFRTGGHFEKAGAFGGVGGELGEFGGVRQTSGHGETGFFLYAGADAFDVIGGGGIAPDVFVHRGEIQKTFVDGIRDERGRVFLQNQEHLPGQFAVGIVMRFAENAIGTETLRLEAGGAGLDAVFLGEPVGGDDNTVATPAAADPDGTAFQLGIERDLATGEETIAIHMQDSVVVPAHGQKTRYALCPVRPCRVVHIAG